MIDRFDIYRIGEEIYAVTMHGLFNKRILGIHLTKNPQKVYELPAPYMDIPRGRSVLITWLHFYEDREPGNNVSRAEIIEKVREGELVMEGQEIRYHDVVLI